MPPGRTDAELLAAIEAMYRIRAVESPPDAQGQRTIWHRASRNAELVSTVDAEGRVLRQELMLFDDVVIWERAGGLKTGVMLPTVGSRASKPSDSINLDEAVAGDRVSRMSRGLAAYAGDDRFITHVRELVKPLATAAVEFGQPIITRSSNEIFKQIEDSRPGSPAVKSRAPLTALIVGVGLLLVAVALVLIFWK